MKLRLIYFLIISMFPGILFSQRINVQEIKPFVDIKNGNYTLAIDSLEIIVLENPQPEFYYSLAETYFILGNNEKALDYCYKLDKLRQFYSSKLKFQIYLRIEDQENATKS
ncbi:tol-pal system YbgF family protein [Bacteroidota bacterium]